MFIGVVVRLLITPVVINSQLIIPPYPEEKKDELPKTET